jgi:hypothetical protein
MAPAENRPAQLKASRRALALLPPWDTPPARDDGLLAQALLADALSARDAGAPQRHWAAFTVVGDSAAAITPGGA